MLREIASRGLAMTGSAFLQSPGQSLGSLSSSPTSMSSKRLPSSASGSGTITVGADKSVSGSVTTTGPSARSASA